MKRLSAILVVLMILGTVAVAAHEPYDSGVAVPIMRANGQAFGQLRAAVGEGEFLAAAGALAVMAEGSLRLLDMAAPQGSQAEWERIHFELVEAALRGIVASSMEDAGTLGEVVGIIGGFVSAGHGEFR